MPAYLQSGGRHNCYITLKSGKLVCWGWNRYGQIDSPDIFDLEANAVATGASHTCGLAYLHRMRCWGWNEHGQTLVPFAVQNGLYLNVKAGPGHNCAIRSDGQMTCWGMNEYDQTEVPEEKTSRWVDAGLGHHHSCGVQRNSRKLRCWGDNDKGKTEVPELFNADIFSVAAGVSHTCAIREMHKDAELYPERERNEKEDGAKGGNSDKEHEGSEGDDEHELHPNDDLDSNRSQKGSSYVSDDTHRESIPDPDHYEWNANYESEIHHSLKAGGDELTHTILFCFGSNEYGQTGVPHELSSNAIAVKASESHSCGLDRGGRMWCWGDKEGGKTDVPALFLRGTLTFSLGYAHSCAHSENYELVCWGEQDQGQCDIPTAVQADEII